MFQLKTKEEKKAYVAEKQEELAGKSAVEVIQHITATFPQGVVFSSSFGVEDQVITDIIARNSIPVQIFTIDTGRLFSETIELQRRTSDQYKVPIKTYVPDAASLERLLEEKGQNSFFDSVENRIECCRVRKVEPLKRALSGQNIWITGIRRIHSPDRESIPVVECDYDNSIIKVHPLLDWSDEDVWNYVEQNKVPYNILHKKGYASIGCAPCTRPILEGEEPRAGRWWWEDCAHKECGLHIANKTGEQES